MQPSNFLFRNHLSFAHFLWRNQLKRGDWALDATCGNGHDTLELASYVGSQGGVIALDIQEEAIANARKRLPEGCSHVHFFHQSHTQFPSLALLNPIRLIVYNLGYLPGGDKALTTLSNTSLISLQTSLELLAPGGLITLTCYPGHEEGKKEEENLLNFCFNLPQKSWSASYHRWPSRSASIPPSVITLFKY